MVQQSLAGLSGEHKETDANPPKVLKLEFNTPQSQPWMDVRRNGFCLGGGLPAQLQAMEMFKAGK